MAEWSVPRATQLTELSQQKIIAAPCSSNRGNYCVIERGVEVGTMQRLLIVREPVSRSFLDEVARERFGDMVKVVVDCARGIMAIGGELHADGEQALLDDGSRQEDLWGINLYPGTGGDDWLEYDSMINVRPAQGNRSRSVEDAATCARIRAIVDRLVT